MRLAVYTDYTYRRAGGRVYAERAFALFLVQLAEHFEAFAIVGKVDPTPQRSRYPLPAGTEFVELPHYASLPRLRESLGAMARSVTVFWRVLDRVDGVWLLGPHPLALAFAVLALLRGKSVALGVRQDFRRYVRARHPNRRWIHYAGDLLEALWRGLGRFVPIVAVGPALASLYPRARIHELTVSLVRAGDLAPLEVVHRRSYDDGELRVLSVGRLEEEKNPLLLADIIAQLHAHDPRWRLTICGEGPLKDAVLQRAEQLGVAAHVELLGYVPHGAELIDIYRVSHALLHVSWTEGLPQVLFEAFAARLPVVATAVGGVPAAAGNAALLIEPGDAEAAVRALERVCGDAGTRARLVEAGLQRAAARTLEAEAGRLADFLAGRRRQ
jgi:glycosyltransferase involved in cell wall biosynthesis